ncbi:hypothetical protein I314_04824 [Cryptococcus bacillisporus CA1873]|uniref:CCZ1/INTU/HSP4 first Longin domain-containing protein n=1 Tax=Cryptococcus bacillisporus CA1873 TaxID=1296111 RepID=A0ABR5B6T6_CRYGA|nr:hypothetical protein I314_04824 [Cryptococcus bacillisporus CA1873]|eukprot:KIR59309.1 hypothetical protein I314_04824 [Cryptococcus gattii CA1873]
MPPRLSPSGPSTIEPANLSHFAIFNPNLDTPAPVRKEGEDRNKDDEDDQKEAAQILFYTSREAGGISRDKMLRQVGLAKGLMGFADMLANDDTKFWAIHSHKSRLIVYTPESGFYIYSCITLAHNTYTKDPAPSSQGISDLMLVSALGRGYEDFRFLHGPLSSHTPLTSAGSSLIDKYFTRFAFNFESACLSFPSLSQWIGGFPPPSNNTIDQLLQFFKGSNGTNSDIYVVGKDGPLAIGSESTPDPALLRYLVHLVQASLPQPVPPINVTAATKQERSRPLGLSLLGLGTMKKKKDEARKASWATLGGWAPDLRLIGVSNPGSAKQETSTTSERVNIEDDKKPSNGSGSTAEKKDSWAFGWGAIGDAVESVGTVFGLGGAQPVKAPAATSGAIHGASEAVVSSTLEDNVVPRHPSDASIHKKDDGVEAKRILSEVGIPEIQSSSHTIDSNNSKDQVATAAPNICLSSSNLDEHATSQVTTNENVQPSNVSIPELEDAAEPDVEIDWDNRAAWIVCADGVLERRKICWIIRDSILIAIILPGESTPPFPLPSAKSILSLVADITQVTSATDTTASDRKQDEKQDEGAWIYKFGGDSIASTGKMGVVEEQALIDLRGILKSTPSVSEVFAKTSSSHFVLAKQKIEKELYAVCETKEASLTDAEHSLRTLLRSHPEIKM